MFLFKPKQKSDEILPPPPPFSDIELEEELKEKPKFFDKILKPEEEKSETFPEQEEFGNLIKDIGKGIKPKKAISKKEKISLKKLTSKKQKIPKKVLKQLKKIPVKPIKARKSPQKKITTEKITKNLKSIDLNEDFGLGNLKFDISKDLEKPAKKDIELPDTLEGFDIDGATTRFDSDYADLKAELEEIKAKPKEIWEAEEEIKSAIEKIKEREKPSFLGRLFAKRIEERPEEERLMPIANVGDISIIQNKLNNARQALMKFDLETAKKNYIEVMRLYNKIRPEEKAKVYQDIKDLYFERKSAEELKV